MSSDADKQSERPGEGRARATLKDLRKRMGCSNKSGPPTSTVTVQAMGGVETWEQTQGDVYELRAQA